MTFSAPLSSAAYFTPAIFAFQNSSNELAISTNRLASGNRITRVGDDVSAFSIATRLQSQLSGLRQASSNVAQGASLLQVAEGGLSQISDILDSMKALATQSNSAALTTSERSYLQAQFAEYLEEIDRIAGNTAFNDVTLLDGTLGGTNNGETTETAATKADGSITLTANPTGGQTIILNGATLVAGTSFTIGGSISVTIDNILTALASSTNTALTSASYAKFGSDTITITAKSGGTLGEQYTINKASSTASFTVVGDSTSVANIYTLSDGADDGLGINSTKATGTIGDSLVTTQSQVAGSVTLYITGTISNNETIRFDDGNGGYRDFTFKTSASGSTEVQIGATTEETLQNLVNKLTQYSGTDNYGIRQLEFEVSGNNLTIRNKTVGNPTDLTGAVLDIAETMSNATLSAATITGGATTGVNVSGVNNGDFVGEIQGFAATYVSSDSITLTITVGDSTYTATMTDTTPVSATTVRFSSSSGGYFDVQIAAAGATVGNQTQADTFADRLNSAFAGLSFSQERIMSNFNATGDFIGASARIQLDDFSDISIDSISVTAPSATDGTIDIVINGEIFRASSGLGSTIGAYETVKFVSVEDSNKYIKFTNGATAHDFSDATDAADFEEGFRSAFGLDEDGTGADFQVGVESDDVINVVIGNSTTDRLFNGATPNISTQSTAEAAADDIDTAQQTILTLISRIGGYQRRFESASTVINSSIEGVTAAKSNLVDTDIVSESTIFALATLKVNSAVAVIAQTKNLQSSLLSVLQSGNS